MRRLLQKLKDLKPYHGAGILFWYQAEDGQLSVLLGLRTRHPQKGQWSIPAGGWEGKDAYDENKKRNYDVSIIL